MGDVGKVAELITGITQASQEQAQGVEQVNTAVAQMDKVTQQNAAGAEESASAAEQLSAQAETVNGMVAELEGLVHGASATQRPGSGMAEQPPRKPKKTVRPLHHSSTTHTSPGGTTADEALSPDTDFKDF